MKNFLVPIDMNHLEIQGLRLHQAIGDPSGIVEGQIYYDTSNFRAAIRLNGGVTDLVAMFSDIQDQVEITLDTLLTANSILICDSSDNLISLGVAASRIVGRKSTGEIDDLTAAEVKTILALVAADISDFTTAVRANTLNQMAAPTTTLSMASQKIGSLANGTAFDDAVNKSQLDAATQGLLVKEPVRLATTTAITIASDLNNGDTIDGVALVNGDRVLVKNQGTTSQNGIYVAGTVPARATDMDATGEVRGGTMVFVEEGSTQADSQWVVSTDDQNIAPGTDPMVWVQFSGAGQITAGNALTKTGNQLDVAPGTGLEISSDTIRIAAAAAGAGLAGGAGAALDVTTGTGLEISSDAVRIAAAAAGAGLIGGAGSALAVGAGTGITVNADDVAVNTAVVVRKYAVDSGSSTSQVVTHGLGTRDVTVAVYRTTAPYDEIEVDVEHYDSGDSSNVNKITIRWATAPTTGQYRIVVQA